MTAEPQARFFSPDPDTTAALARRLAPLLRPGDTICLEGRLGAGKTHFARALIGELTGETEVPSPTYTLVQTYEGPACEVWHADLYRLSDTSEVAELGLVDAFDTAIAIIEWPDRLDPPPPDALWLRFEPGESIDSRSITARSASARVTKIVEKTFDLSGADV